jgi:hypothetical protein
MPAKKVTGSKRKKATKKATKKKAWQMLKDWNWSQMSGLEAPNPARVIGKNKTFMLIARGRDGGVETRTFGGKQSTSTLRDFGAAVRSLFAPNASGDQMLIEIRRMRSGDLGDDLEIYQLFFDS